MIEQIIQARETPLVGGMTVKRILPFRARRSVGPFVFLDEMGPLSLGLGKVGDVPPHPHIGLSTLTYLFDGGLLHRDSLGTVQLITPGDVNWMTAGEGVVHSERIPVELRQNQQLIHGLQAWVALPQEHEDMAPAFEHFKSSEIPQFEVDGVVGKIIAGTVFGKTSPVAVKSPLFYFSTKITRNENFRFELENEGAFYLCKGNALIESQNLDPGSLVIFKPGSKIQITALSEVHGVFLGGEPLDEPRFIQWNFVSSRREKIEEAKRRWRAGLFPKVPSETEFVPLPSDPV